MLSGNQSQSNVSSSLKPVSSGIAPSPLGKAVRTALVQGQRIRVNSTYPDGTECVEEYDKSDLLLLRKWRKRTPLGKLTPWEIEVGEVPRIVVSASAEGTPIGGCDLMLAESTSAPIVARKDTKSHFLWRIRNLPYPKTTYSISVDSSTHKIIVRTSNKKYFTRLAIPDLYRLGLPVHEERVSFDWSSNTLVIMYEKPIEVLEKEKSEKLERVKLLHGSISTNSSSTAHVSKNTDQQCQQQ